MARCTERGFTLLELLVVGVLVTILASIAFPRMGFFFSTNRLRTSTSAVTSTLYLARMKAVNDGEDYGVQFHEDGTMEIVRDPYGTQEVVGSRNRLEEGIEFSEITFIDWLPVFTSFGQLNKECLPSGAMTGYVYLNNDKGDTTRVEVNFITGRIRETNL